MATNTFTDKDARWFTGFFILCAIMGILVGLLTDSWEHGLLTFTIFPTLGALAIFVSLCLA